MVKKKNPTFFSFLPLSLLVSLFAFAEPEKLKDERSHLQEVKALELELQRMDREITRSLTYQHSASIEPLSRWKQRNLYLQRTLRTLQIRIKKLSWKDEARLSKRLHDLSRKKDRLDRLVRSQELRSHSISRKSAVRASGAISGSVTDADTSTPLQNIEIDVVDIDGAFAAFTFSDEFGHYETDLLADGTYFVFTINHPEFGNSQGYVDELYNDFPCFFCDPTDGTPITVSGGNVTNINFELDFGGTISGEVRDAATLEGLQDVMVHIVDVDGNGITFAMTDASGNYTAGGLPTGTYFAHTINNPPVINSQGYVNELYNNKACPLFCDETEGTFIEVTLGTDTPDINFDLDFGGSISGQITDAATLAALEDIGVDIVDSRGAFISFVLTDSSGNYTAGGLPTGAYFASTFNDQGYLDELHNNVLCSPFCDLEEGTPIIVNLGQDTPAINFQLDLGGSISGTVIDANTSAPLEGVFIDVFSDGPFFSGATTDASGNYIARGLPKGKYFVVTFNGQGYVDEAYNNSPCSGLFCDFTEDPKPKKVRVKLGTVKTGINFDLDFGGSISGTILDGDTLNPIEEVEVDVVDSNGRFFSFGFTDSSGSYTAGGLPSGNYFAVTFNDTGYLDELHNNISCPFQNCEITNGNSISVVQGQDKPGINFNLDLGGSISGKILDVDTSNPISNVAVHVLSSDGFFHGGFTNGLGNYSAVGLVDGNYFALTINEKGYVDELHNNISCAGASCDPFAGTPIQVILSETTEINFNLDLGGSISGNIMDAGTSTPLKEVDVRIFDSSANLITFGHSNALGNYKSLHGLPAGNYFVTSSNDQEYIDEVFNNIPCDDCDPTTGTPANVVLGAETANINFALDLPPCQLCDEFDDNVLDPNWTYEGSWAEDGLDLIGDGTLEKAEAVSNPIFAGCSVCTLKTTVSSTGDSGKIFIGLGNVTLLIKEKSDTWTLKQKSGGASVKTSAELAFIPGVTYEVKIVSDGFSLEVFVEGDSILFLPSLGDPFGPAKFEVKATSAKFGRIEIR